MKAFNVGPIFFFSFSGLLKKGNPCTPCPAGVLVCLCRCAGVLVACSAGELMCWGAGVLVGWWAGGLMVLVCWCACVLVCCGAMWCAKWCPCVMPCGVLVCWCVVLLAAWCRSPALSTRTQHNDLGLSTPTLADPSGKPAGFLLQNDIKAIGFHDKMFFFVVSSILPRGRISIFL